MVIRRPAQQSQQCDSFHDFHDRPIRPGHQHGVPVIPSQLAQQEYARTPRQDNLIVAKRLAALDHQQRAIGHTPVLHRITAHLREESVCGIRDDSLMKVEWPTSKIIASRRESGHTRRRKG
jgi:hypothetical protein